MPDPRAALRRHARARTLLHGVAWSPVIVVSLCFAIGFPAFSSGNAGLAHLAGILLNALALSLIMTCPVALVAIVGLSLLRRWDRRLGAALLSGVGEHAPPLIAGERLGRWRVGVPGDGSLILASAVFPKLLRWLVSSGMIASMGFVGALVLSRGLTVATTLSVLSVGGILAIWLAFANARQRIEIDPVEGGWRVRHFKGSLGPSPRLCREVVLARASIARLLCDGVLVLAPGPREVGVEVAGWNESELGEWEVLRLVDHLAARAPIEVQPSRSALNEMPAMEDIGLSPRHRPR